jgi:hypothetical protein
MKSHITRITGRALSVLVATGSLIYASEVHAYDDKAKAKKSPYKVSVTSGVHYSTGDYGQAVDTEILYIPVTAKVKYKRWTTKVTIPYLEITGPGAVLAGDEGTTTGVTQDKDTQSGMGDVIVGVSRSFKLNDRGTFGNILLKLA